MTKRSALVVEGDEIVYNLRLLFGVTNGESVLPYL